MTRHKSKINFLSILSCCVAVALSGCGDSMTTQEQIVTPKETIVSDSTVIEDTSTAIPVTNGIREQVQVPEHYTCDISEGNITVMADADFLIPEAEGFKSYKVTPRIFNQEDYDIVSQALLDGAPLWSRDYEAMAESHGFIKAELEERIAELKEEKASGFTKYLDGKPMDYDARIAEFEELMKHAPEEPIIYDVAPVVPDSESVGGNPKGGKGYLNASATVRGEDYDIWLSNILYPHWNAAEFNIHVDSERSISPNTYFVGTIASEAILPVESITKDAIQIVAEMGYVDLVPTKGEYYQTLSFEETAKDAQAVYGAVGYGIPFERVVEGIPITYTHEEGLTLADDEDWCWPYERFILTFDEKGFTDFQWRGPCTIEKVSDDTVFLLPFFEIQNVLEEMMVKIKAEEYAETDIKVTYKINEIRLGYMRVHEKGDVSEGSLIPVWDFFGSESLRYPDDDSDYSNEGISYESQFTINAMDGTIVDRGLGY